MSNKSFKKVVYYVGVDILNFPIYTTHYVAIDKKTFNKKNNDLRFHR